MRGHPQPEHAGSHGRKEKSQASVADCGLIEVVENKERLNRSR